MLQARRRQDRLPPGVGDHVLGLIDPGDHQPGAPGDNVEGSERQLLPSRELRDPLDQEFQVGLDRPKSVPAWLWFAGIRDAFYSTRHRY